jgi:hypothetical protein
MRFGSSQKIGASSTSSRIAGASCIRSSGILLFVVDLVDVISDD